MLEILTVLLPILYGLLGMLYALAFFREDHGLTPFLRPFLTTSLALHILYLILRTIAYRHIPLANVYETLTIVAAALTLVYWLVERVVRTPNTGMFVLAVVMLFQTASAAFIGHELEVKAIFRSPLFAVHTTTAVVGYTAFALSAIYGVLYLMLYHELKVNRFGIIYGRLPSLDILATMHDRAVQVGVFALTIAVGIGMVWLPKTEYGWALGDPKVLLTLLIWLLYLVVLAGNQFGLVSRIRLIFISILGFVLLVFSSIAVNLWLSSFHAFT
jgi:HemX protein